jgi:hypothetical protein
MNMKRNILVALMLSIAVLIHTAFATEMIKMDLARVSSVSDRIVMGKVVNIQYVLDQGEVWTVATILPEVTLKGRPEPVVYVRIPGGMRQINGRTQVTRIEGAPSFNLMQKGIFFLEGKPPRISDLAGWTQGYRRVETRNGREMVAAAGDEIDPEVTMDLSRFLDQVRSSMKQQ